MMGGVGGLGGGGGGFSFSFFLGGCSGKTMGARGSFSFSSAPLSFFFGGSGASAAEGSANSTGGCADAASVYAIHSLISS